MHVAELARMGAGSTPRARSAVVRGVASYQGAPVMASDLRASAALVLAGLAARGRTEVSRIYHLDRGYEQLENKLATLGARIERQDVTSRLTLALPKGRLLDGALELLARARRRGRRPGLAAADLRRPPPAGCACSSSSRPTCRPT